MVKDLSIFLKEKTLIYQHSSREKAPDFERCRDVTGQKGALLPSRPTWLPIAEDVRRCFVEV